MKSIAARQVASGRKRRAWRFICLVGVLVLASLAADLMVFTWLSSLPATSWATAAADEKPGEHLGVPHIHIRF